VAIQGETVLHRFDIAKAAGGTFRSVVKEFKGVTVTKNLVVTFAPADEGRASLSLVGGVEIIEEGK
jgi:hypothetical protein